MTIYGQTCLVTAAHVLDSADQGALHFGCYPESIELKGAFRITNKVEGKRSGDHVDVAVALLDPETAAQVANLGAVAMADQSNEPGTGDDRRFMVTGYRYSQNKTDRHTSGEFATTIWSCTTSRIELPNAEKRQHRGQLNFALNYPKQMQRSPTEPVVTTPPQGVSGGAIFDLGSVSSVESLASGIAPPPKLVGILIECHGRVLIGTKFSAVHDAYNDLVRSQ